MSDTSSNARTTDARASNAKEPRSISPLGPKVWRTSRRTLEFGVFPKIMGILNVTPDSFSDGGRFFTPQAAIDRALQMEDEGADIIDIGGESTRPYAEALTAEKEIDRVLPVINGLRERLSIPVSIDTSKAIVARVALENGAEIVNDICGLSGDPKMIEVAANYRAAVCAMHIQGTPQTMQDSPTYENVVEEIFVYLQSRYDELVAAGIDSSSICLDPGIGFGKTHEHNLTLIRSAERFQQLPAPILVGHSRKGFIAKILGDKTIDRTAGTLGVSLALARKGVQILRVHDVAVTSQALRLFEASGGLAR